jgi:Domain of unknown function (DUF4160)
VPEAPGPPCGVWFYNGLQNALFRGRAMPRISQFYGIAVYLYYRDHAPPHFHAIYGEYEAEVAIATATILQGTLPRKARSLVTEWAEAHREELQRNWDLARAGQPLEPIEPLE